MMPFVVTMAPCGETCALASSEVRCPLRRPHSIPPLGNTIISGAALLSAWYSQPLLSPFKSASIALQRRVARRAHWRRHSDGSRETVLSGQVSVRIVWLPVGGSLNRTAFHRRSLLTTLLTHGFMLRPDVGQIFQEKKNQLKIKKLSRMSSRKARK